MDDEADPKFATPQEAALSADIPVEFLRVMACGIEGTDAVVVLGTNEPPRLYPILVDCAQDDDGWFETSSSGPGAGITYSGPFAVLCDEAPAGEASVVVRYGGEDFEVPVVDGWFAFVSRIHRESLSPIVIRPDSSGRVNT